MTMVNDNQQPIDPRLQELLDSLRETPPRNPEAEARGRAKFLAELDSVFDQDTRPVFHQASKPLESRSKWRFSLAALQQRLAFTTVMAVFAILILLFGGAGATAYASQGALPGDALYPVKTSLEQTQVRLARNAARQAELHLSFAERRLVEIASLIAEGDFDHIETATSEFEAHVQEAIRALETVSAGDPQRAGQLATQITSALTRYAEILKGMLISVPDTVKPSVEKAILISEQDEHEEVEFTGLIESISDEGYLIGGQLVKITPQTEIKGTLGVGAMVKVHAMQAADGTLTAREIEVTLAGEENVNENANANEEIINANDNMGAGNLNTNEIENENEMMNLSNEDDGMHNSNANQNMNDNTGNDNSGSGSQVNMNNNDNSGSGGMSNDNSGSGGMGNDNSGSGGNSNDNSGSGGNSNDNSGSGGGNSNGDD